MILCVLPAGATFVPYSDLALWQQVTTLSATTVDFSSLGVGVGGQSASSLSLVIGDITFTSPTGRKLLVVNASSGQSYYNWGTAAILRPEDDGGLLKAALASPVTAFAALMGINKWTPPDTWLSSQMDVKVRSGETVVWEQTLVTSAHPTLTFFGIVSTDPAEKFDSVTFAPAEGNTTTAFLDNVMLDSYQAPPPPPPPDPTATPEMGTGVLSLCGGILLVAGGFRRRLKRSQKA
jgi:hypothetical protein